ncbi:MAG: S8 family serine peptidase [Bacteroidota bacterium]
MKKTAICLLLILCLYGFAQPQAKFGKLLERSYPLMNAIDKQVVILYFTDKSAFNKSNPREILSDRSIKRRTKIRHNTSVIDDEDLPLNQSYVQRVTGLVSGVRHQLKWFNAVSAFATKSQIDELRNLPFVKEIDLVGRWKVDRPKEDIKVEKKGDFPPQPAGVASLNYGTSYAQLQQINVPAVHDLGYYGQGIIIGVFDNGVRLPSHQAFDSMTIIATHDFVDHKTSVVPLDTNYGFGSHGVNTLSLIGANDPGNMIGPAFKSHYILARTENDSSETPIEEDNWAKAAEWADSIGVDVTSTSLGYLTFDPPYPSLTWQDMDGVTALITRAGDRADSLGIVVLNAAGNSGHNALHNTLIAPADGINIITVGAVDISGNGASFSSNGPTVDGRIKPDICALGVSDKVADGVYPNQYDHGSGTSYATPLSAGVAALVLCANPGLTPAQVRDAMRNTASMHTSPDNYRGWGIINALAALHYFDTTLAGRVFNDVNGNGAMDVGEAFISGIKVRLTGAKIDSMTTDANGRFWFDSLTFGTYTVSIDSPGAISTTPIGGTFTSVIDSMHRRIDTLTFGEFVTGTIKGQVFNDINWDGQFDSGDSVLANWPVKISGPLTLTTYTDTSGNYSFTGLGPGAYTVHDSLPAGWISTAPPTGITYSVTMRSNLDTTGPAFGNLRSQTNEYDMKKGWNLISLSQAVSDRSKNAIYSNTISRAFIYQAGYQQVDTVTYGAGFWLKFDSTIIQHIDGGVLSFDTVIVNKGWNMIGCISSPVPISSIIQQPDSIVISQYYGYDGTYQSDSTLAPGAGYWVKTKSAGVLILRTTGMKR